MESLLQDKRLLSLLFGTAQVPLVIYSSIDDVTGNEHSILLPGNTKQKIEGFKKVEFCYILNKDKSIRWLIPSLNKQPFYLSFYNQQSLKAKLYAKSSSLLFALGLKKVLMSGSFTLFVNETSTLLINDYLKHTSYTSYSVFMGTKGPNRKISIGIVNKQEVTHFLKLGTSIHSIVSIQHEKKAYKKISKLNLQSCILPNVKETSKVSLIQINNLQEKGSKRLGQLSIQHLDVQKELYEKTLRHSFLDNDKSYEEHISIQLKLLRKDNRFSNSSLMINRIKELYETLDKDLLMTSLAHGDFTPWNMFLNKDKLAVYDWELCKRAPLLFDVFHFIYQNEILVKKGDFKSIQHQLKVTFSKPEYQQIINKYSIDINTYHKWYLIENISTYLNYFHLQDVLHEQVYWLVQVWQTALIHFEFNQKNKMVIRNKFISELFTKMRHTNYGLLKSNGVLPHFVNENSDIDLVTTKQISTKLVKWIKQYPLTEKIEISTKSYMQTCKIWFKDESFLSIDLITEFKRRNTVYLNPNKLLISAEIQHGVKFVQKRFDFEYIVKFYRLNNANIPVKYIEHFESLSKLDKVIVLQHLNMCIGASHASINDFNSKYTRELIKKSIQKRGENKLVAKQLKNNVNYLYDLVYGITKNKGKVITLSGVDGAGKTTILNELVTQLRNKYREDVVVLRHRPSILPIISALKYGKKNAENRAATNLPRTGKNKSVLSSYLRFIYYLSDYSIGQFYIFFKYSLRGKTIIYDRYYFDFISDPKRSNLNIHPSLAKFLYRIIFKPNLNILLHAPSVDILKRKQELSKETIEMLTQNYKKLFSTLQKNRSETYLSINNIDKDNTLKTIMKAYLNAN
jgi:thymidylate kinase